MSFNPFEAGRGLSTKVRKSFLPMKGLNPFGTGRGLSTYEYREIFKENGLSQSLWNRAGSFDRFSSTSGGSVRVSIPLEQGGVFRHLQSISG